MCDTSAADACSLPNLYVPSLMHLDIQSCKGDGAGE